MSNPYLDCYIRVSTDSQEKEGNSLEVQETIGKQVSKNLGLKFRLHKEGVRSSTTQYREVLEELKLGITQHKIKNVWSYDKSRLFRDMTDGLLFRRDYLEKYKISLYEGSVPTKLDLDSPEENLQYGILMLFNQYENENRSRKSQLGVVHKLKKESPNKPIYLGGTSLFGYKNVNKEWKVNKDESKWVRYIYDSYEKGKPIKDIKDDLDRNGIQPRRKELWDIGTILSMLKNKTFTGIHTRHQKKINRTFTYKVPKIINVGQYNRIQKLLERNQKYKDNNKKHFSLLEDFLVCSCGTRMGSRHLKTTSSLGYKVNTRTYYCLSSHNDWKTSKNRTCENRKSLQMDSLNEYVLNFVKDKVSKSVLLKEKFKKEVMEDKFQKMKDIKETEKKLENQLQKIQIEIERIENNIVEMEVSKGLGKQDEKIVDKIIKRYGDELEQRNDYYKEIENQIDNLGQDKKWLNWVEKYGQTLQLKTSNEEKQKEFLNGVLKTIIINPEYDFNRDEKKVQKGHSVEFLFKMKIVDDSLNWIDKSISPQIYEIIEGKDRERSNEVMKFISKRNRTQKKN